jgi:hypothetical protein
MADSDSNTDDSLSVAVTAMIWSVYCSSGFLIGSYGVALCLYLFCRKIPKTAIRRDPGSFGATMIFLECIDSIPEALVIAQGTVNHTMNFPFVLSILFLNIVNTVTSSLDTLATYEHVRINRILMCLLFFVVAMLTSTISTESYFRSDDKYNSGEWTYVHILILLFGTICGFIIILCLSIYEDRHQVKVDYIEELKKLGNKIVDGRDIISTKLKSKRKIVNSTITETTRVLPVNIKNHNNDLQKSVSRSLDFLRSSNIKVDYNLIVHPSINDINIENDIDIESGTNSDNIDNVDSKEEEKTPLISQNQLSTSETKISDSSQSSIEDREISAEEEEHRKFTGQIIFYKDRLQLDQAKTMSDGVSELLKTHKNITPFLEDVCLYFTSKINLLLRSTSTIHDEVEDTDSDFIRRAIRLLIMMTSVFCLSLIFVFASTYGLHHFFSKLPDIRDYLEAFAQGLSGGAFLSTISGTMIFRLQKDYYASEWKLKTSKIVAMLCYILGILTSNFLTIIVSHS